MVVLGAKAFQACRLVRIAHLGLGMRAQMWLWLWLWLWLWQTRQA